VLSLDTNLILYSANQSMRQHQAAIGFIDSLAERDDVVISELVLVEVYVGLRNQAIFANPATPADAVEFVQVYRNHPRWRLVGFPHAGRQVHDALWRIASSPTFARRRIYDTRLALSLIDHGVTEFATVNTRDFQNLGFERVWNPLA
jgi:predicted nucleic acid-binding protein